MASADWVMFAQMCFVVLSTGQTSAPHMGTVLLHQVKPDFPQSFFDDGPRGGCVAEVGEWRSGS